MLCLVDRPSLGWCLSDTSPVYRELLVLCIEDPVLASRQMNNTQGLLTIPCALSICHCVQGLLTMVAFWADVPPQPDQLCKLQIIACLELAAITLFTILYLAQLWRHFREVQPDAERYLAAAWLPVHGCDHSRCAHTCACEC